MLFGFINRVSFFSHLINNLIVKFVSVRVVKKIIRYKTAHTYKFDDYNLVTKTIWSTNKIEKYTIRYSILLFIFIYNFFGTKNKEKVRY